MVTTDRTTTTGSLPWLFSGLFFKFLAGFALVVVAMLASGMGSLMTAEPAERVTDDKLAARIQSAIANDPYLKPYHLNLLVNVVDRAAVIGGPVSDRALTAKIEAVARAVPGVLDVKVSVWVPAGVTQDPFAQGVAEAMAATRQKKGPQQPAEPPLGGLVPLVEEPLPMLSLPRTNPSHSTTAPRDGTDPQAVPPLPEPQTNGPIVVRHHPAGLLLEPVAPPKPGPPPASAPVAPIADPPAPTVPGAAPLPYRTIPPTRVPTVPATSNGLPDTGWTPPPAPVPALQKARDEESEPVFQAIEELRRRDGRFADLQVDLRGKVATIRGRAATDALPWEFAAQVRKLAGVERVILGQVEVRSR